MTENCSVHDGEYSLTLPLFDNKGRKVKPAEYRKYIRSMNNRFGGSSSWRASGCYNDENEKPQCEGVVKLNSLRDMNNPYQQTRTLSCEEKKKLLEEDCQFIKKLSREAQKEFGQYSLLSTCSIIKNATLVKADVNKSLRKRRESLPEEKVTTSQEEFEPFREMF